MFDAVLARGLSRDGSRVPLALLRIRRRAPFIGSAVLVALVSAACSGPTSGSTTTTTTALSATAASNQLVNEGLAAERAGNLNQAFVDYRAAAVRDPGNIYAHYDLGYIYQLRGLVAEATSAYATVLQINPKFSRALYNMGVLETPFNPSGAKGYYLRDLQVEPNNASANFNLGVLMIKHGEKTKGFLYLEYGLRLDPALAAYIPAGITFPSTKQTATKTAKGPKTGTTTKTT
ncbi:MAG TPA: hypothetical protein VMS00_01185 [Acidimicrobiales bacterium]|nr:hypothetical protein [Acidimicrobiales bacterium]